MGASHTPDADALVADFLAHFGVKGMKWGVRNADRPASPPAHDDHATAEAAKVKLKSGGAQALSNKEFEAMLNRMNLEQRLYNLNDQKRKQVSDTKFLFDKYKGIGKKVIDSPGGKMAKGVAGDVIKKKGTALLLKKVTNEGAKAALKLALGQK